jgi:hypothetical protein
MTRQVPFRREAQLSDALDYLAERPLPVHEKEPLKAQTINSTSSSINEDISQQQQHHRGPATPDVNANEPDFTLPGYPELHLSDSTGLLAFLQRSFCAPDLERMAPYMWMMSTQSSSNVNPLHHQLVKGRDLVVTEDPRLHCVWIYDKIFLKPLPTFLLSHAFWETYLLSGHASPLLKNRTREHCTCDQELPQDQDSNLQGQPRGATKPLCAALQDLDLIARSALGYLRTYAFLIQHPSDFALAQKHSLVPATTNLRQLSAFTALLTTRIRDTDVSARYAYGELRLTRLNFYGKFILHRWHFMRVHGQYGEYFARFYGPLLFVFTVLSLILDALQVEMSVEQAIGNAQIIGNVVDLPSGIQSWVGIWELSRWVAALCAAVITTLALSLVALLAWFHADEWKYAIKDRIRKKRELRKAREV